VTVPNYSNGWKVPLAFVASSYARPSVVKKYSSDRDRVGLWNSEKIFYERHLPRNGRLLDLGCGAGRTTFGLLKRGWTDITGADLSAAMIRSARAFSRKKRIPVKFVVADGRKLPFKTSSFDSCLFSFNGLMQIPSLKDRVRAMREIRRVLRPGGRFVFTTHDRERAGEYLDFWKEELVRWKNGSQHPGLHEFGDLIVKDVDAKGDISFIHIPTRNEVAGWLEAAGFEPIEDLWRPEISGEPERVKKRAADCRFWAARKPGRTAHTTSK